MPFKSQAQRGFLFATHPQTAKKFAAHSQPGMQLPEHVQHTQLASLAMRPMQTPIAEPRFGKLTSFLDENDKLKKAF